MRTELQSEKIEMIKTKIQYWVDLINKNSETQWVWALRGDNITPKKSFRPSRYHGDDNRSDTAVGGVSCVSIPTHKDIDINTLILLINDVRGYGDNVFLLHGEFRNTGEDKNEIILGKHKIADKLSKEELDVLFPEPEKYSFKDFVIANGRDWNDYDFSKRDTPEWKPLVDAYSKKYYSDGTPVDHILSPLLIVGEVN